MLAAVARNSDFREMSRLKEENERLRQSLEERKRVERAKGIMMRKEGIPEDDAYRKIQKLSMDKRKRMVEIADAIILADELAK